MERPQRSQVPLITSRPAKSTAWLFFSTGDESWFFYHTPHRKLWILPDVDAPDVARQLIAMPKLMITIFWGISLIHVIDYLPPGTSFDSTRSIDHILRGFNTPQIINVAARQKESVCDSHGQFADTQIKSVIAKISSMPVCLALHPPYWPHFVPPNSFLFGHI
jgi:hypothetical protein